MNALFLCDKNVLCVVRNIIDASENLVEAVAQRSYEALVPMAAQASQGGSQRFERLVARDQARVHNGNVTNSASSILSLVPLIRTEC